MDALVPDATSEGQTLDCISMCHHVAWCTKSTERSAKPLFIGSIPIAASKSSLMVAKSTVTLALLCDKQTPRSFLQTLSCIEVP